MSVLKLVYIAHGWHLESSGTQLVRNRIEAWKYGPVIPDVYNAFRPTGLYSLRPIRSYDVDKFSGDDERLLEEVWKIYGHLPAMRLSEITHEREGPWETATMVAGYYGEIPDELIKRYYINLRKRAEAGIRKNGDD